MDCEWVAALTASLGQLAGLRPALRVIASNLAFVRDGRLVIPRQAEPTRPSAAALESAWEASVCWTPPVRAAIEIATTAVRFTDLTAQLASRFPAVHQDAVTALANGLVDGGFLVTSLDPPMAADDPLACVIAALREADSAGVAGLAPRLHTLEQVSNQIRACNRCSDPAESARLRATVAERMRALAPVRRHPSPGRSAASGTGLGVILAVRTITRQITRYHNRVPECRHDFLHTLALFAGAEVLACR